MTEKFGSGRFCSRSCANTRQHSKETKNKISSSNKKTYYLVHNKKENTCKICGQIDCNNDFCKVKSRLQQINTLVKYFEFDELVIGTKDVFDE